MSGYNDEEIQDNLDEVWDNVAGGKTFMKAAIYKMLRESVPINMIQMRFEDAMEEMRKELG